VHAVRVDVHVCVCVRTSLLVVKKEDRSERSQSTRMSHCTEVDPFSVSTGTIRTYERSGWFRQGSLPV
jgi:hypothetical protein